MREWGTRGSIEALSDCSQIGCLKPRARHAIVGNAIHGTDLRHAFAIHAVFDNQQTAYFRHKRHDHGLDRSGAGSRHQHCAPFFGRQCVGGQ
jgi:hypothetical protein